MTFVIDDACPFDWAEYNLPAELLSQETTLAELSFHPDIYLAHGVESSQEPGLNESSSSAR